MKRFLRSMGWTLAAAAGVGLVWSTSQAAAEGRFTVSGGNVLDSKTSLVWQQTPAITAYPQSAAVAFCQGLGSGWRLPTIKELQSIVDFTIVPPGPTFNAAFSGTNDNYWSSTLAADFSSAAWYVGFSSGVTAANTVTNTYNVRCVR